MYLIACFINRCRFLTALSYATKCITSRPTFLFTRIKFRFNIYIYLFYVEKELLTVATEDDLIFEVDIVTKRGTATGTTYGYLMDDSLSLKMEVSGVYFQCSNCYVIESINNDDPFFLEGDSGSGVYVIDKYSRKPIKPLGIAFAFKDWQTAVCNISETVDALGLQIVRFVRNKDE